MTRWCHLEAHWETEIARSVDNVQVTKQVTERVTDPVPNELSHTTPV